MVYLWNVVIFHSYVKWQERVLELMIRWWLLYQSRTSHEIGVSSCQAFASCCFSFILIISMGFHMLYLCDIWCAFVWLYFACRNYGCGCGFELRWSDSKDGGWAALGFQGGEPMRAGLDGGWKDMKSDDVQDEFLHLHCFQSISKVMWVKQQQTMHTFTINGWYKPSKRGWFKTLF